jgi:glycosyltransferase involved in cell wall biosynthesis/RimJ/RimL family protein N-acetyltransferase
MKIAWFTPLSKRSAIAEYSLWVANALAELCEVELWASGTADSRPTDLPVIDFGVDTSRLDGLAHYDLAVYNLGNHERYHFAIYEAAQKHPGVVVLHDRVLHHFFFGYWFSRGRGSMYIRTMEAWYGAEGRRAAEDSFAGIRTPVWEDDDAVHRFSLLEEALVGARGAVVHAQDHGELIRERWFGPVAALFLPAYPPAHLTAELPRSLQLDDRLTLLTVGYVNRNKQIHRVVEAIAEGGLHDGVRYLVVGPHDPNSAYAAELEKLIRRCGLEQSVQLIGYQSDEVLGALLRHADVLINLRHPTFEGASASLMQGLAVGKPTLVYDSGGFAQLPDDAVVKIPPADREALIDALQRLVTDDELRRETGARALAAAQERGPERYAREFLAFVEEVRRWAPALELCDHVTDELGEIGVSPSLPTVDRVARETSLILANEPPSPVDAVLLRTIEHHDATGLTRFFIRNDDPKVFSQFDPFPLTEENAVRIALQPTRDRYYGAFLGDRVIALSMLRGWDEGYEVPSFGIAVDVDFHGEGLGTLLTSWTLEQARLLGCKQVRLSVYGSNKIARRIYERLGFTEVEREQIERPGGADDRIVMVRELAA